MHYLPISGLPIIEEEDAEGEVAELYEETKRVLEMPFVPNLTKAVAAAPNVLAAMIGVFRSFFENLTLPQSLVAMISYCIPEAKNCTYCAANGELHCRTIGIDEKTLHMLAHDLGNVSPLRVRAIIEFALKCALDPQDLAPDDYDNVRSHGVTDEELLEIIMIAAMANFTDTFADALKIEVDELVSQALGR
jgi:uncharacterized peroxidase-related enzyme